MKPAPGEDRKTNFGTKSATLCTIYVDNIQEPIS